MLIDKYVTTFSCADCVCGYDPQSATKEKLLVAIARVCSALRALTTTSSDRLKLLVALILHGDAATLACMRNSGTFGLEESTLPQVDTVLDDRYIGRRRGADFHDDVL